MIKEAFIYAQEKHKDQIRKSSQLPYIIHLYDVARILTNNHAPEYVIVAGILHDTLEDTNATESEIEQLFGQKVKEIVVSETENKALCWKERKQDRIDNLKNASLDCKMVKCADMLANLSDLRENLKSDGECIWKNFRGSRQDTKWYFESMIDAMKELKGYNMYNALKKVFEKVFMSNEKNNVSIK